MSEYTGLNFFEVSRLDYIQYLVWRRDAFIFLFSRSEAGQEYLDNAWRLEQVEPDRTELRNNFGKEG